MRYIYPAVFTKEEEGYSIRFPDLESCYTSAPTLEEGMDMAVDVLSLVLMDREDKKEVVPKPSDITGIVCGKNEFTTLVSCDTTEYRKRYGSQAVKKTLSIPAWLNEMAEREGINFSGTLQDALKRQLNI